VYDQLVRPSNRITNYLTDKSGITEELLRDVTTSLAEVQTSFLQLVTAETILVGHALENDLRALKVVHMRCIDTGALFPHPKVCTPCSDIGQAIYVMALHKCEGLGVR
jgi:RNA exonuclease 1